MKNIFNVFLLLVSISSLSQNMTHPEIPAVLDGLSYNAEGKLVSIKNGQSLAELEKKDIHGRIITDILLNPR